MVRILYIFLSKNICFLSKFKCGNENLKNLLKSLVLELNEDLINTVSEKLSYELDVDLNKSILEKPFFNENNGINRIDN